MCRWGFRCGTGRRREPEPSGSGFVSRPATVDGSRDIVDCGAGRDTAIVDRHDRAAL